MNTRQHSVVVPIDAIAAIGVGVIILNLGNAEECVNRRRLPVSGTARAVSVNIALKGKAIAPDVGGVSEYRANRLCTRGLVIDALAGVVASLSDVGHPDPALLYDGPGVGIERIGIRIIIAIRAAAWVLQVILTIDGPRLDCYWAIWTTTVLAVADTIVVHHCIEVRDDMTVIRVNVIEVTSSRVRSVFDQQLDHVNEVCSSCSVL